MNNKKIIVAAIVGLTMITLAIVLVARNPQTESSGVQLWERGPYWAECNVGATKPKETGYYFQWGDMIGYKRNAENSGWISVNDSTAFSFKRENCPTDGKSYSELKAMGYIDSSGNLVAMHDAATANLGAPWRMPTNEELESLYRNCDIEWTKCKGVFGRLVKGRGAYASKSIFLPAAGYGFNSGYSYFGSGGYYWSSTACLDGSCLARYLVFSSNDFYQRDYCRNYGQTIRPVRGYVK